MVTGKVGIGMTMGAPDIRADLGRCGLRLLHRRRLLTHHRRVAGRLAHAHHDDPRRHRDGPLVTRHQADRTAVSQRCRQSGQLQVVDARLSDLELLCGSRFLLRCVRDV